jgi:hypothetical protein
MIRNEARGMVNLPDLDEADELITPPKGAYIMTCPMPVAAPSDQTPRGT